VFLLDILSHRMSDMVILQQSEPAVVDVSRNSGPFWMVNRSPSSRRVTGPTCRFAQN
jgi:hypothetical protein